MNMHSNGKIFGDKCWVEGYRLWSENGDECGMGGGVTQVFAIWTSPVPQEKTLKGPI